MAADAARALVRERLYAPLVLGEPEPVGQVPYELEPLAILLDECMEMVEFRDAERAAEHKALCRAYDERAAQTPAALASELEHTQFNYALALDAVAALQPDPDATCVEGRARPLVDDAALDTLRAEHDAALEALRAEHSATLESLHAKHAEALAARTAAHDAALHTTRTQHAAALAAQAQAHTDALDAERATHADAQRDAAQAHDTAVRALQDTHTRATEALAAQHADELQALRTAHAAALDTQRADHVARAQAWDAERAQWAQAMDAASAQRAADARRIASLAATVDALARSVQQSDVLLASVRERVDAHEAWDAQHARAYAALAERYVAHSHRLATEQAQAEAHEAARTAAEQARDAAHAAAEAKTARAHEAERRLAELQRDVEQTREVQADVAALQARAAHAEAEVTALRERAQDAEPLRVAAAQLQREVDELQTVVSMHKTSAKHAEQDHVRAEETIRELYVPSLPSTSNIYVLEHAARARDDELASLRDARQRHTEQIRALKAAEKAWRAERDAGGWHERIAQLELELSAKAEEVEEADTRILSALRDNKRLAAQNKALQAKLAHASAASGGEARVAQPLADRTNRREAPPPVSPGASPDKAGRGEARFRDRLARFKPAT
ncbi:hypothetical protein CBS9595_003655 [Malassezia furfur]|nr:hypothetical protein CBS9595_003655 [Malassezia furfur]